MYSAPPQALQADSAASTRTLTGCRSHDQHRLSRIEARCLNHCASKPHDCLDMASCSATLVYDVTTACCTICTCMIGGNAQSTPSRAILITHLHGLPMKRCALAAPAHRVLYRCLCIPRAVTASSPAGPHMCRRRVVQHAAEVLAGGAHAYKVAGIEARVQPDRAFGAHACRVRPAAGCAQARFCSGDAAGRCRANNHMFPKACLT